MTSTGVSVISNGNSHTAQEAGARRLSTIGGGALALYGLTRGTKGGLALALLGGALAYRGLTGDWPITRALDVVPVVSRQRDLRVVRAVTVQRSPEELYQAWRDFEQLPRFMRHLERVTVLDNRRSHWVAKAPLGTQIEWDAEIVEEQPPHLIRWRSLEGATVQHAGEVRFSPAPGGRGTEVKVRLSYRLPGGAAGAALAKLLGEEPGQQIGEDVRRFKQLIETGEIATVAGQPHGSRGVRGAIARVLPVEPDSI